jgi:TPR repeat protein
MKRVLILVALVGLAAAGAGCAATTCAILYDKEERVDACKAEARGNDEQTAQQGRDHDAAQKVTDSERAARASAGPACQRGEPHACLNVAVYDEQHHAARRSIGRAYAVACAGNLAFGCYGAVRFEPDPATARSLLVRGCDLGEPKSCEAAAVADPAGAPRLHELACQLGDYDACEGAGFAFVYGTGVPVDHARARTLLARGCDHASARACELLRELQ